ncbi:hypothetical protein SUGI_0685220 [Cryptomeria japonica]|nr:hypothetical protein SUGI_0685220 [Cryptomeria japonica]
MEKVVQQTRKIVIKDPVTRAKVEKRERIWNYTLADISLLAVGTSFPHISLATIDAFQNLGQLYAGGLGPATLVGSAAFNLYPIHAVLVIVPKKGTVKKISDLGVWLVELVWSFWAYIWLYIIVQVWTPNVVTIWEAALTLLQFGLLLLHAYAQDKGWRYFSLPMLREDRPNDWVPAETSLQGGSHEDSSTAPQNHTVDCISEQVPHRENMETFSLDGDLNVPAGTKRVNISLVFLQQLKDALTVEDCETRKNSGVPLRSLKILWRLINLPWKILFAFIPPSDIAHGWLAFIGSLCWMTGISYLLIKLTDLISCVTGLNKYVTAFTALASGTSWPDLIGSKIAAERQTTADSAIANITCSNSANIFVGIGIPWLISTTYNRIVLGEVLRVPSEGLSFSLVLFFIMSCLCMTAMVLRRYFVGAELGGPRVWAWITFFYLMFLWIAFAMLASLKASHII